MVSTVNGMFISARAAVQRFQCLFEASLLVFFVCCLLALATAAAAFFLRLARNLICIKRISSPIEAQIKRSSETSVIYFTDLFILSHVDPE